MRVNRLTYEEVDFSGCRIKSGMTENIELSNCYK
jgi:hypothetical protein